MSDSQRGCFSPAVSGFVIGALVGAGVMFFLSPRSGRANRELVKGKIGQWQDYLEEEKEALENKVRDVFGEVNALTTALYSDTRKLWDSQVRALEKTMAKIDKRAYQEMVENVIEKLQGNKKYSSDYVSKVKRYLNGQWRKFNELMEG
jgi:gas vesicle protein